MLGNFFRRTGNRNSGASSSRGPRGKRNSRRGKRLAFESLERRIVLDVAGPLLITEFLAANDNTSVDDDNESSDWIEVHNPTDQAISLAGWSLTEDPIVGPNRDVWTFPGVSISAGDYLLVYASGKNRRDPANPLHTDFQLTENGEYLGLIRDDGLVAHEYAPEYPNQRTDVSYGLSQGLVSLVSEKAPVKYLVPDSGDAGFGTSWTTEDFDDSAWTESLLPNPIRITEVGKGSTDWFEIQNVGNYTAVTEGWFVAVNWAQSTDPKDAHTKAFELPDSMGPEQVIYTHDDYRVLQDYLGENIWWSNGGKGWVMLADELGTVVDFVAWGYTADEIATIQDVEVTVNDVVIEVTVGDAWSGDGVTNPGTGFDAMQRTGNVDHDNLSDFAFIPIEPPGESPGEKNPGLQTPLAGSGGPLALTGLGFATTGDFDGAIQTDLTGQMLNRNASVWARIPFAVDNLTLLSGMQLHMRYEDGFVAYLNGVEIARRYAPATLSWNSRATTNRSDGSAFSYEDIDVSAHLGLLELGENMLAIHGLNDSPTNGNMLILPELTVGGTHLENRYFFTPTPDGLNGSGYADYVRDTKFSVDRGFFDEPFELQITTSTLGATIRYTTDGSVPTEINGIEYTGPIVIGQTTVLRAVGIKDDYRSSTPDTQTYIFLDDVIRQSRQTTLAAGFPATWGSYAADYGMDTDVIGRFDPEGNPIGGDLYGGRYARTIRNDLQSLPTMSIVMNSDDMFGPNGIYTRSTEHGEDWEHPASVELIYPDGTDGFQVNAGIRIQGAYFRQNSATPKHSLRLLFKDDYGPTKLRFPLFGDDAADRFDTITLRAGANDGYSWDAAELTEQYVRDEFGRSLQLATGNPASHGTFVHLYINGAYWGLYNPVERPDNSFAATYFGGEKEDWDSVHDMDTTNGDINAWNAMTSASNAARTSLSAYMRLQGMNSNGTRNPAYPHLLDVPNYIDYLTVNVWGGNWDWPWKNWWAGRDRTDASTGFKFFNWDFENTIGNNRGRSPLSKNALNNNFSQAGQPHESLKLNLEYRMLFADRVHRLFFNDGVLTPGPLIARYRDLAGQVERAMVAESARWGDQHHNPPLTLQEWRNERTWVLGTYLPARSGVVLQQLINADLYPSIVAPTFNQHGGFVSGGFRLNMTAPQGDIYYTLDGTDPRRIGGSRSTAAIRYTGSPVAISETSVVKSRVYINGQWSALNEAEFFTAVPATAGNLAITELNYHPQDPTAEELDTQAPADLDFEDEDFEFVELRNTGTFPLDLRGVQFSDGVYFDFTEGNVSQLAVGETVMVVKNEAAFEARYGSQVNVAGTYEGLLDNGGERIVLTDHQGALIHGFRYDNSGSWPGRADGKGSSLEILDTAGDYDDSENWRSSAEYGGSPGSDGEGMRYDVIVTEVLANSPDQDQDVDWFELFNPTLQDINLGGWFLSDSSDNFRKYEIAAGTILPAGGYLVFDESQFNPTPNTPAVNHFALNGDRGDDVWLLESDASGKLTRFVEHAEFAAMTERESWGRWPDASGRFYPMKIPTPAEPNNGSRVGPLVFTEIMYNPPGPQGTLNPDRFEYVEILNASGEAVDLTNWRIRKGIDFDFPAGMIMASGETLVVVPFDLSESSRLSEFRDAYDIESGVRIVGGYTGLLENAGERIQLQRPGIVQPTDPTYIPRLLEDEVIYDELAPWPTEPDGSGQSLVRLGPGLWGNDATNWAAADPSPGSYQFADDAYEPNDRRDLAYHPGSAWEGEWLSSFAGPGIQADDDWYRINVTPGPSLVSVDLTFDHGQGNIDLALHDASGALIVLAESDTDNEHIEFAITPGDYYLKVYGANARGSYDLTWSSQAVHPGDADFSGATDLSDFNLWNAHKFMSGMTWAEGDFNFDGNTDLSDFNIWNAYKFTQAQGLPLRSTPAPSPVDVVLVDREVEEDGGTEALLYDPAWLDELQQQAADRSSEQNAAEAAVDRLLATYWQ